MGDEGTGHERDPKGGPVYVEQQLIRALGHCAYAQQNQGSCRNYQQSFA